jgi:hypothetical protein
MAKGGSKKTPKKVSESLLAKARERDATQSRQYHKDVADGIGGLIHQRKKR